MRCYLKILTIATMHAVALCSGMDNHSVILEDHVEGPLTIEDVILRDLPVTSISNDATKQHAYFFIERVAMHLVNIKQHKPDWHLIFPMLRFNSKDNFELLNHFMSCLYFQIKWAGEDGAPPNPVHLVWCLATTFKSSMIECGERPEDKGLLETLDFLIGACVYSGESEHPPVFSSLSVKKIMSKVITPATLSFFDHFLEEYEKQLQGSFCIEEVESDPLVVMMKRVKELYHKFESGAESETFVFSNIAREMYDAIIAIDVFKDRPYWAELNMLSRSLLEHQSILDPFFHG